MATTDLKLDEPGTLPRPGPVGRIVRLLFGVVCVRYVYALLGVSGNVVDHQDHIHIVIWNGILPGLLLVSYIINIGYSRAWKKWPAILSAAVFLLLAGLGYFTGESLEIGGKRGVVGG